jgi:subtilisin family serine protease
MAESSDMKYVVLRDLQRARPSDRYRKVIVRDLGGPSRPLVASLTPENSRIEIENTDAKGQNDLMRDPEVVAITPSMPTRLIEPFETARPSAGGDSWGVEAIGAAISRFTGAGTTVAVLDTGIDASHPAFAGIRITEQDFSGSGNGDRKGHGTHCAGTIFGRDVDGNRIGVAKGVKRVFIGKVLSDAGEGSSEMIFRGLRWAAERGVNVIAMSLGFDFPGMVNQRVLDGWPADLATSFALEAYRGNLRMLDTLMSMIKAQESFGMSSVVVAAAGNESKRHVNPNYIISASLPAAADGVLSTGALCRRPNGYAIAPFSNGNPKLCAPGVEIKSAFPGDHVETMSGTSMACPHVAGAAALWWESVRANGLPATASTVISQMMAGCRLEALAPGIDIGDRGNGLVSAP